MLAVSWAERADQIGLLSSCRWRPCLVFMSLILSCGIKHAWHLHTALSQPQRLNADLFGFKIAVCVRELCMSANGPAILPDPGCYMTWDAASAASKHPWFTVRAAFPLQLTFTLLANLLLCYACLSACLSYADSIRLGGRVACGRVCSP